MKNEKIRIGLVGLGARGLDLLRDVFIPMSKETVDIYGICDYDKEQLEKAARKIAESGAAAPVKTTDYRELVALDLDAVVIMTSWVSHVPIALAAMEAGKAVGLEVGGAYSLDDCWRLVHTSERTGRPCMLLENCCYGKRELMVLNMVKKGLFGDIVACDGGYQHDLRWELAKRRPQRLYNYMYRNCENYPTHELGPIAKILNINNGNRLVSLTSQASCAKGLHRYVQNNCAADDQLAAVKFAQGDIVKTMIKCAGGELITLSLDTTLPRAYSRGFTVRGTAGSYFEDTDSVFLDGVDDENHDAPQKLWGNAAKYEADYLHPLWRDYDAKGGHGGMDWQVFSAFFESVRAGVQPPLDVYDAATLMSISVLSEQSIAAGGAVQAIPDFTNGAWIERQDLVAGPYALHDIFE